MSTEKRNWQREHGLKWGVPPEIDKLVDEGVLADISWHNDAMASFECIRNEKRRALVIWVDAESKEDREFENEPRYMMEIVETDDKGQYSGSDNRIVIYNGDDLGRVLENITKFTTCFTPEVLHD